MPVRSSQAEWKGDLQSGAGTLTVGNKAYVGDYSFKSRFEEGAGTNPEELIAAAHAACYSMQLSAMLAKDGHTPTSVDTQARVSMDQVDGAPTITKITLTTKGSVPGLSADQFTDYADKAKAACLVTRALAGVETVELSAELV